MGQTAAKPTCHSDICGRAPIVKGRSSQRNAETEKKNKVRNNNASAVAQSHIPRETWGGSRRRCHDQIFPEAETLSNSGICVETMAGALQVVPSKEALSINSSHVDHESVRQISFIGSEEGQSAWSCSKYAIA